MPLAVLNVNCMKNACCKRKEQFELVHESYRPNSHQLHRIYDLLQTELIKWTILVPPYTIFFLFACFMSHFGIVNVETDASASEYRHLSIYNFFSLVVNNSNRSFMIHIGRYWCHKNINVWWWKWWNLIFMRCLTCLKWIFYGRFMNWGLYLIKIGALVRFQIAFSRRYDKNSCIRILVSRL